MKILSSASARPNFVKLAAVHHALAADKDVEHVIVHTGQHYDPLFSDVFFSQLSLPTPSHNLGVRGGSDREGVITATAEAFKPVLEQERPDLVLVYGDVNGAVGAARAASSLGIPVGHVEAGLRSGDLSMPEEHNRIEIDGLSQHLFTTEASAAAHLKEEGVKGEVHFVGNTMIDTLVRMRPAIDKAALPFDPPEPFCIATLHRPSNVDSPDILRDLLSFLGEISSHTKVVLPLHLRTKAAVETHGLIGLLSGVRVVDPLGYIEFLHLLSRAAFIVTDSGGIQEEAAFLGKRCFTLRRNTERPSTIESGSNLLIDPSVSAERDEVLEFAAQPVPVSVQVPALWDGQAGERIAGIIRGLVQ